MVSSNSDSEQTKRKTAFESKRTRRESLKQLSAVSPVMVAGSEKTITDKINSLFNRRTRIVTGRTGPKGDPVATRKVAKKWLQHQRAVREVTDSLRQKLESNPPVGSVSYDATTNMINGCYTAAPTISLVPSASPDAMALMPKTVEEAIGRSDSRLLHEEIQIRKMNGQFRNTDVDCYRGVTSSPFKGGLQIKDNDSTSVGTAGFPVYDGDFNHYMYTANHVIRDDCEVPTGDLVTDADSDALGFVDNGHKTHDWIVIGDRYADYSNYIKYDEGEQSIDGYASQNGMDSIQGTRGTCKMQGITSGYQDCYVKGGGASYAWPGSCVKMFGSATKMGVPDSERDGDSGGPIWWEDGSDNLVVGNITGTETKDFTFSSCGGGEGGSPMYTYPFWRVANNTSYWI
ncbi:hypothetical protein G9C85_15270 [Halorubellus sp. JP-L1]|uniref:hypothetical protein n=1 Tax=Halorubellus sp. JP-L1 TaxID=2715753 RepID=UPI00140A50C4|nr:hypothetical protein [Halorubellus sp. JP-L1]NHN42980.1 hypothetical protein [Halorubellus sp. JP-L1]